MGVLRLRHNRDTQPVGIAMTRRVRLGTPYLGMEMRQCLPGKKKRAGEGRELLANRWHGVSDEHLMHVGLCLDVGGDHYGMLS